MQYERARHVRYRATCKLLNSASIGGETRAELQSDREGRLHRLAD